MKDILDFLTELRQHNNRDWFNERKDRFYELRATFLNRVDELIRLISVFDEEISGLEAKDCVYRIYRDTRFSPDKTPYKTFFSAYIASKGGKKSLRAGYYLHLEPGNCLLGGGVWCPESKLLKELREAVYEHCDEFIEITENPEFKKVYPAFEGEMLKTIPRPFPKDFKYPELLMRKDYVVMGKKQDRFFEDNNWIQKTAADFKVLQPLNRFLNYTVDEVYDY